MFRIIHIPDIHNEILVPTIPGNWEVREKVHNNIMDGKKVRHHASTLQSEYGFSSQRFANAL